MKDPVEAFFLPVAVNATVSAKSQGVPTLHFITATPSTLSSALPDEINISLLIGSDCKVKMSPAHLEKRSRVLAQLDPCGFISVFSWGDRFPLLVALSPIVLDERIDCFLFALSACVLVPPPAPPSQSAAPARW